MDIPVSISTTKNKVKLQFVTYTTVSLYIIIDNAYLSIKVTVMEQLACKETIFFISIYLFIQVCLTS